MYIFHCFIDAFTITTQAYLSLPCLQENLKLISLCRGSSFFLIVVE